MSYTAAQLIELLHLLPHPEGGWYAFRESSGQVLPGSAGFSRSSGELQLHLLPAPARRNFPLASAQGHRGLDLAPGR